MNHWHDARFHHPKLFERVLVAWRESDDSSFLRVEDATYEGASVWRAGSHELARVQFWMDLPLGPQARTE